MQDFDFCYEMADIDGETVTVYGDDDGPAYVEYFGPAYVEYFDHDAGERRTRTFERGEFQAYSWAYARGYRE